MGWPPMVTEPSVTESAGSSAERAGSDLAASDLVGSGDLGFSSLEFWAMASGAASSAARVEEQRCRIIAWEGLLGFCGDWRSIAGWRKNERIADSVQRIGRTLWVEVSTTEVTELFWAEEGLELGVGFEDVFRDGAHDVDAEVMVFR